MRSSSSAPARFSSTTGSSRASSSSQAVGATRIARESLNQEEINELLVHHGQRGRRVVRLKGGDPFIYGRGSEEVEALAAAGVEYEVVPGLSTLTAIPGWPASR